MTTTEPRGLYRTLPPGVEVAFGLDPTFGGERWVAFWQQDGLAREPRATQIDLGHGDPHLLGPYFVCVTGSTLSDESGLASDLGSQFVFDVLFRMGSDWSGVHLEETEQRTWMKDQYHVWDGVARAVDSDEWSDVAFEVSGRPTIFRAWTSDHGTAQVGLVDSHLVGAYGDPQVADSVVPRLDLVDVHRYAVRQG